MLFVLWGICLRSCIVWKTWGIVCSVVNLKCSFSLQELRNKPKYIGVCSSHTTSHASNIHIHVLFCSSLTLSSLFFNSFFMFYMFILSLSCNTRLICYTYPLWTRKNIQDSILCLMYEILYLEINVAWFTLWTINFMQILLGGYF